MTYNPKLVSLALWLTFASSAAVLIGIAPSQILLGMALLVLLVSGEKLRLPPIKLPLGLFLLGTLLAVAVSGDPLAGMPQVKKIYVFTQLLVAYTLLRETKIARWLVLTWAGCGAASALLALSQFGKKLFEIYRTNGDVYTEYLGARITGFMSHWYTFSVEEMLVLLMLVSFILFSPSAQRRVWLWWSLLFVIGLGVVMAETRAVWLALVLGIIYLVWCWRPLVTLAIPVGIVVLLLAGPAIIRQRAMSIVKPAAEDSNEFRFILMRTGVRMVEAHPWLGLGPEIARKRFFDYLPSDIPLPLPDGSYMHLHNIYLQYAAERGIPVFLIFLWLMGKILWDFIRGVRALPPGRDDRRFLLHGGIAVIISMLVEGMADVNFGDSEDLAIFLVVVALGYNALRKEAASNPVTQESLSPG